MKLLETNFDEILQCNYNLYSCSYLELQTNIRENYKEYNLKEFDQRHTSNSGCDVDLYLMKQSGLLSNLFYTHKNADKLILLDGFNRLLTDYAIIDKNQIVYIKELIGDVNLMSVLFNLNLWKLYNKNYGGFSITDFMDRGFRLFLKTNFHIEFYYWNRDKEDYLERKREKDDIKLIDKYFIHESEMSGSFKYDYKFVDILFKNKYIVDDFKELLDANNYRKEPFNNYDMFLEGYAMFLSFNRIKDVEIPKFNIFLNKLYLNEKYFNKLKSMCGNDSTRKSIYKFYRS